LANAFIQQLYAEGIVSGELSAPESIRARAAHVAKQSGFTFVTEGKPLFRKGERWKVGSVKYKTHTRFYAQTQAIRENWEARASSVFGRPLSTERLENLTAVIQAHEGAEAFYLGKTGHQRFGSHASESVIQSELEVARRMGPQTAADTVRYRRWESEQLVGMATHQTPYWNTYRQRMGSILDEFESQGAVVGSGWQKRGGRRYRSVAEQFKLDPNKNVTLFHGTNELSAQRIAKGVFEQGADRNYVEYHRLAKAQAIESWAAPRGPVAGGLIGDRPLSALEQKQFHTPALLVTEIPSKYVGIQSGTGQFDENIVWSEGLKQAKHRVVTGEEALQRISEQNLTVQEYFEEESFKKQAAAKSSAMARTETAMAKAGKATALNPDEAWAAFLDEKTPGTPRGLPPPVEATRGFKRISRWKIGLGVGAAALAGYGITKLLPDENRGYYSFDGFQHAGTAPGIRRDMTPFGSKYDRVRKLAGMMEETFEMMTSRKGFKQALQSAKLVKTFEEGSFATAGLYRASYKGKSFRFVKKEISQEAKEELMRNAANPEKYARGLDLEHEAKFLRELGETPAAPSLYGHFDDALYMEYMPGERMGDWAVNNPAAVMTRQAKEDIEETIYQAAKKGFTNLDIHGGNILFDPKTGRGSWIDWGLATREASGVVGQSSEMSGKFLGTTGVAVPLLEQKAHMMQGSIRKVSSSFASVPAGPRAKLLAEQNASEGMKHGGMAQRKRSSITEFGSKWKGMFGRLFGGKSKAAWKGGARQLPERLQVVARDWQGVTARPERLQQFLHADIEASGLSNALQKNLKKEASQFLKGAKAQEHYVIANPRAIKEGAAEEGVSYLARYKGVMRHERFHQSIAKHKVRDSLRLLNDSSFIPEHFHKFAGKNAAEEYFAYAMEQPLVRRQSGYKHAMALFKGNDAAYTRIEALHGKNVASQLRKVLTDFGSGYRGLQASFSKTVAQAARPRAGIKLTNSAKDLKLAQENIWEWARGGGQRHTRPTGSHVQQLSNFGGIL